LGLLPSEVRTAAERDGVIMFELIGHVDVRVAWVYAASSASTTAQQFVNMENYRAADLLVTNASVAGLLTVQVSQATNSTATTGAAGRTSLAGTAYSTSVTVSHSAGQSPAIIHIDASALNVAGGFSWLCETVFHGGGGRSVGMWVLYRPRYAPPVNATLV